MCVRQPLRRDPIVVGPERWMTSKKQQEHGHAIPDVRALPLDRLEQLAGSALAHSIALYRHRMQENCTPLNSFNSSM